MLELDHLFLMVAKGGPEAERLATLGLIETYRRPHPGQGTANICYAFDNLFLELLWVDNETEAQSEAIARTGLFERSRWREDGTNPFGVAWREQRGERQVEITTWGFTPPYLPEGITIPVAADSDDRAQPLMFRSPGSAAPITWPTERSGVLQHPTGLTDVTRIDLMMPASTGVSHALAYLAEHTLLNVQEADIGNAFAILHIKCASSTEEFQLRLPDCRRMAA